MSKNMLPVLGEKSFEDLKHFNQHGAEYWNARELQPMLGYSQWRRFEEAIKRAMISCEKSGNQSANHFAGAGKMVDLGSGSQRKVPDYQLSRFACYLIAQNGDPRKPEIAKEFKALSGAAHEAGVQNKMFGVFHDAGYKGLYGGLGNEAIKTRKGVPSKEQLMDRMGTVELAANQFRMTQTRDKLTRERIKNQERAIQTHEQVGKEVRAAIERIGGTMPENIPPVEHIKQVAKRLKSVPGKLKLEDKDAKGLIGGEENKENDAEKK